MLFLKPYIIPSAITLHITTSLFILSAHYTSYCRQLPRKHLKVSRLDSAKSWLVERSLDLVHARLDDGAHSERPVLRNTGLLVARVSEP